MQFQFCADIFAVTFDRANADAERISDGAAGLLLSDHSEDAAFARRQVVKGGLRLDKSGGAAGTLQ